jgi:colanic acid/amylovoran biosynthesis protein
LKILITNVYTYFNKGDAAIVLSMLREAERVFPGSEVTIQTADPLHDHDRYGVATKASLLWILLSSVRNRPLWMRMVKAGWGIAVLVLYAGIFRVSKRRPTGLLSSELRLFVEECHRSDLVVACGGGYLNTSDSRLRETILLTVTCFNFLFSHFLGKKVCMYSQSVGPVYGPIQHRILALSLNKLNLLEAREDISAQMLEKLHVTAPQVTTADTALLLSDVHRKPLHVALPDAEFMVGLTVRPWFKGSHQQEQYLKAVAKNLDRLVDERNARSIYLPQVIAAGFGDDDRSAAVELKQYLAHPEAFTILDDDFHPYELIYLCSKMRMFIGTRMHSNIFSLVSGVPVVALEYEHKTRGIMKGFGLEELTIKIGDVTDASLRARVDLLLKDYDKYVRLIHKNLPLQQEKARMAMQRIGEAYAQ